MTDKNTRAKKPRATRNSSQSKAQQSEDASKHALASWCQTNGWQVLFLGDAGGPPRKGIVDAIIAHSAAKDADALDIRLVQLKSGAAGVTGADISRLSRARNKLAVDWLFAAFDGAEMHFLPEMRRKGRKSKSELRPR